MKNKILLILFTMLLFVNCRKDDGNDDQINNVEPNDRTEQQVIDNDSLIGYFETHYYNSTFLADLTNPTIDDIVITILEEGEIIPDDHTLLIDDIVTRTTVYVEADYEYYILNINQGGGDLNPHFCDDVRVNYFGTLLDDDPVPFDSIVNSERLDLLSLIRGWQLVIPEFQTAETSTPGSDGTVDYDNFGLGVMFLPSGLGFFSSIDEGIPTYSPLIFKFELLSTFINDHDSDNVPTYIEDFDNNLFLDDDTDEDTVFDFLDFDDDGDGTLTIDEDLEDTDLLVDSDGDGDPTNDKNGDGDPTNDDTDGDGIPNYLDVDDTESRDN